jgi:hypothetical protein
MKVTKNNNEWAAYGKKRKRKTRRIWNKGMAAAIWTDICKLGSVQIGESGVWVPEDRVFS